MYKDILKELSTEYERKRDRQIYEQRMRKENVYKKIPAIRRIDEDIFKAGLSMSKYIIGNPDKYMEAVEEAKGTIEKLKMEKAYLLTESNIPVDYMDIKYECNTCNDTGYLDSGSQCNCLRQALVSRAYKMSNIENSLEAENFKTFNINVFSSEPFGNENMTPRENMQDIVSIAEGFISNFNENNGDNLLFYGTTGLGKTFLCSCIAKSLLDKNKIVIYQTAFTILEIIEGHRFKRDTKANDYEYNSLFDADLLIIDDLGTEVSNTFTNAEIFNIVNTRIIGGKKTIISTNLTPKEISEIYTDRIFSRILDKFIPLKFYGPDLRWE
ncbi:ATP-binding protein [Tissierella pigra]|uniref:DNA replication protein DnaC n=1 Tax=Tissierella pigra TaxID=2607614 RepID=A0A6N7XHZ3_9FIRM|nr:ATP-binding protein [Tissierella pigra]MBU5428325.1 ATP-binding protein [Tissierella pigra]MSU01649.1 DNA replication protein DnaC [Tissierella pigra]